MKKRLVDKPVVFTILMWLLMLLVLNVLSLSELLFKLTPLTKNLFTVVEYVTAAVVVLLIYRKKAGKEYRIGLTSEGLKESIMFATPVFLVALISPAAELMSGTATLAWSGALMALVAAISPGINEEFLFRGIGTGCGMRKWGKDSAGIYKALLCSALIFGLQHAVNFVQIVINPELTFQNYGIGVVCQIIETTFSGILLAAIYIRTRNLWGSIIGHTFNNFMQHLVVQSGNIEDVIKLEGKLSLSVDILPMIIISAICLIAGLYIVRREKHEEIIALWNK